MTALVFLIDVDNTLLDNDKAKEDYDSHMRAEIGEQLSERFWTLYEEARRKQDVVDIPLALQWLREQTTLDEMDDITYEHVRSIFENYPFEKALYPETLETLHYLSTLGLTVIVSDGDQYFQARKIVNSDLAYAVQGRVLLYIHKQQHLDEILQLYPADHYAMIDDKPQILHDAKAALGARLTTVFVKQGKYAHGTLPEHFAPDITVEHIGDLRLIETEQFYT